MATATVSGKEGIQVIEFHMMDKRKYFPLTVLSGLTVRTILYPFNLIKTRIQIQKHSEMYGGTFDAFRKVSKSEGFRGLYKGFWVTNMLIIPQMSYISTYEGTRQYLKRHTPLTNNKVRSFISGGCASLVSQSFVVPIDIVSQHLMMLGMMKDKSHSSKVSSKPHRAKPLSIAEIPADVLKSRTGATKYIIKCVYANDGILGFYKGYLPSLAVYAPSSAMWWFFYDVYSGLLASVAPVWIPRLVLQVAAAPLGGISTMLLTNPMDIIRARIQVEGTPFTATVRDLWKEERMNIFIKGLSARLVQSIAFSFFIILGYESIKRWSLLEEHKDAVRW